MNNAKKWRKTTEKGRLEISSRKLFKGTFHPKMGAVKSRNSKDIIEAEEIKKRWKEYTEELYKKDLNDLDNHHGAVSQSDILECEVKRTLGSTAVDKASDVDGI